jgi:hypothetical protein
MAKKPSAPSLKPPEGYRTPEDRWGTKHMTPKEKMKFGNMVVGHNMAQQGKPKKPSAPPVSSSKKKGK